MQNSFKRLLVLMALLLPFLFFGLGERPVYKIQEVRIAETAREMQESGDWIIPRYNGELRLQKPPLPYWVTAASYRIAGPDTVSTRAPAALAGLCLALLLWFWGRRELGEDAACNSVAVLIVSFLGLRYFRSGEADALLLLCISAACKLGFDILQGRNGGGRRLLFGLMLGLGFLSKGPAALSIPLFVLLAMVIVERRRGRMPAKWPHFFSLPGAAVGLVAAFGWYAWIFLRLPDAAQLFFGRQIDETFISGNHPKALWWYLSNWLEFFAPWSVLIVPAGVMAYRRRNCELPPLIRFAWIWLGVVFILLTLTINKQTQYALLFASPTAILVGHYLADADGGFRRLNRVLFVLFCLAVVAGIVFALFRSPAAVSPFWLALPLVPLALGKLLRVRSRSFPVVFVAGLTSMAFLFSEAHLSKEPHKVAAQLLMREAVQYSPLFQSGPKPGRGELSFYAGRVVPPVETHELPELLARYPEVWLVGEAMAMPDGVSATSLRQVEELHLLRLTRRP